MPNTNYAGPCKAKCPGGHKCCLDKSADHELHVCKNPACECHGRARYEATRKRHQPSVTNVDGGGLTWLDVLKI